MGSVITNIWSENPRICEIVNLCDDSKKECVWESSRMILDNVYMFTLWLHCLRSWFILIWGDHYGKE